MPEPLDPAVLAAAAARLSPTHLGWLVRLVANPDGATSLARLDADARARLAPWLRRNAEHAVVGLKVPDPAPAPSRHSAARAVNGGLFDVVSQRSAVAAPPTLTGIGAGGQPKTVKQAAIDQGLRLLMGTGRSEDTARRIIGSLFRDLRDGVVCEAIAAAAARAHEIAEPVGWMRAYAANNYGAAAARPKRGARPTSEVAAITPTPSTPRPLATPEALGISPERARRIQEKNRQLAVNGTMMGTAACSLGRSSP